MKMIDRPRSVAEAETRLDARFDIADGHFDGVWYVCGPVRRFGEGDARGDCCYYGISAQVLYSRREIESLLEQSKWDAKSKRMRQCRKGGSTHTTMEIRGARLVEVGKDGVNAIINQR